MHSGKRLKEGGFRDNQKAATPMKTNSLKISRAALLAMVLGLLCGPLRAATPPKPAVPGKEYTHPIRYEI
jgi:hypothetical protein